MYAHETIELEQHGNFIKQTYRNRCYIAGANGKQSLNIPIIHTGKGTPVPYTEVQIDFAEPWASNHLKSIKSAYNSSPFYQFYEDEIHDLFQNIPEFLFEWNVKTLRFILNHVGYDHQITGTHEFQNNNLANRLITAKKKQTTLLNPYIQVFQEKYGFMQPLSGLDLLFNLGPSAISYLKNQSHNLDAQY